MKNILVNITGRVLGPYTSEEVIRNLLEKRFLANHEVLWPGGRWIVISVHSQFVGVCEKLLDLQVNSENIEELTHSFTNAFVTGTYANTSVSTNTNTGTKTSLNNIIDRTKTALSNSDITQKLPVGAQVDKTQRFINSGGEALLEEGTAIFFPEEDLPKEKLKKDFVPINEQSLFIKSKKGLGINTGKKSLYISRHDKKEQMSLWKLNKFWWIGLCLSFFLGLGFLWQRQTSMVAKKQALQLTLARQLFKDNKFTQSLNLYKQVITFSEINQSLLNISVYKNYALLLLSVDQDSFEVEELLRGPLSFSPAKRDFQILVALVSGDNKEALKFLNLKSKKTSVDWVNLASVYYAQGLYQKSLQILNQLKEKESIVLSILVYIKLYEKSAKSHWLLKARNLATASLRGSFYYKQKISLLKIYIQSLLGKTPQKKDISFILNQDPYVENNIKYNLFVYSKLWSWSNLYSYCDRLVSASFSDLTFQALDAFCLSKGKKKIPSWSKRLESLSESQDVLVGAVLAYIYNQENLNDKYVVKLAHLTESLHGRDSVLLLNLELRYCIEQADKKCIKNRLSDLLSLRPQSLFALNYRMKLYQEKGLKLEANKIQRFFKLRVPDYKVFK